MDAKKLLKQKNYIMKNKKLTEIEIEEIKREMQVSEGSSLEEREGNQPEHQAIIINGEGKLSVVSTTEGKQKFRNKRDQISKLRGKIESTYYQVTQMEVDKRPRLLLLLIPQSFDWLAAFHLDLLQAILFIAG